MTPEQRALAYDRLMIAMAKVVALIPSDVAPTYSRRTLAEDLRTSIVELETDLAEREKAVGSVNR